MGYCPNRVYIKGVCQFSCVIEWPAPQPLRLVVKVVIVGFASTSTKGMEKDREAYNQDEITKPNAEEAQCEDTEQEGGRPN